MSIELIRKQQKDIVMQGIHFESINDEINYLCKYMLTSRPEQYVYTYLKELFPNVVRSKKFEWLCNAEFDIYIPELKLAIEYDGIYWHKEKSGMSDSEKNQLAKENGITIFRIREKGLEEVDCDYYIYVNKKNYENIDEAINATIKFINMKFNRDVKEMKKLNFNDLSLKVVSNLREQKKKWSILGVWSEIEQYWDYEGNDGIKPEDIRITHRFILKCTCPYCNTKTQFEPFISYKYYGKYSFLPHICQKEDEYCIRLINQKCVNKKLMLNMDNLEDRRLKDWLIRIAKYGYEQSPLTTITDKNVIDKVEKKLGFKINLDSLFQYGYIDFQDLSKRKRIE